MAKSLAEAALMLSEGKSMTDVPNVAPFSGGKRGVTVNSILLEPTPITKDSVNLVIDAGWIGKDVACAEAMSGVSGCN